MTSSLVAFPLPSKAHGPSWAWFDTEDRFKKNLRTQPIDWPYRNRMVRYDLNRLGLRCPDPGRIDWNGSIVALGCSTMYGSGVCEEDSLPASIERLVGIPTINLGRPGAACNLVRMQTSLMLLAGHRPRGVVILWPLPGRFTFLDETDPVPVTLGPWTLDDRSAPSYHKALLECWIRNGNHLEQSKQEAITTRTLLEAAGIPFAEATYFPIAAETVGCRLLDITDLAKGPVPSWDRIPCGSGEDPR